MSDSEDLVLDVRGHCYCGGVAFSVRIPRGEEPLFSSYCHCENCRRSHSAPLYQVACVDEAHFQVTQGAEKIVEFQKVPGKVKRCFCRECGSKIYNRFPGWQPEGKTPLAFFPNLLDEETQRNWPEMLKPTKHFSPERCVLVPELFESLPGESD